MPYHNFNLSRVLILVGCRIDGDAGFCIIVTRLRGQTSISLEDDYWSKHANVKFCAVS